LLLFALIIHSQRRGESALMPLDGLLLGHYRLLRLLGSGGMGEVYLAEDARIGQQVAIKVMRGEAMAYPESASAKEAARLFEREARAITRLDHPNILPLYAYGEETINEQQLTYLVMPYRKEGTLLHWVRRRGSDAQLSPAEVAPLLRQAAAALQHAHDQHVIHQDIKPTNFLIRLRSDQPERPDLLLSDFGIAKLTNATASASQSIRGTPTYMAPEQWDGHPVPATDQYALAVMVYELLVGRPPFVGNPGQVMRQHYLTPPPAPSTLNAQLSPAIDAVLLRALAKEPGERFASVTDFARAFEQAVLGQGRRPGEALQAILAISPAEAVTGTMRNLTLPGGRLVEVTIPAGVSDGAVLRLEGLGMPSSEGGSPGPLLLTISVQAADTSRPLIQGSEEATIRSSLPNVSPPPSRVIMGDPKRDQEPSALPDTTPLESGQANDVHSNLPVGVAPPQTEKVLTHQLEPTPSPVGIEGTSLPSARGVARPPQRSMSRRIIFMGLAGLLIVALAAGSFVWFSRSQTNGRVTESLTPQASRGVTATPTPHPAGVITEFPLSTTMSSPAGIIGGPGGNLWFVEQHSDKIGRLSTNGTITEFPVPTARSNPQEIIAGPDGNLWFTEETGDKIGRISTSGTITEFPIPTRGSAPLGITAGPDGNLWFTEIFGNKIGRISTNGTITEFPVPTPYGYPLGITAGPDGNLWFTEIYGNKIGRISTSGTITEFPVPTARSGPNGITAGPDGNLWFTEVGINNQNSKIGRISTNGTITEFATPIRGSSPLWITVGQDSNLWFTEFSGNKIGRISTSGTITEFPVPTAKSEPDWITAGPDDNLWFTESNGNKIGRITSGK
jgi:serine/threonine protein kinase/streptogramin lyase